MFGKLLLIVLAVFVTAAALLVIRQQRLEIAHDVSQSHRRITENEQTLWRLQAEIAARCRPDAIRRMLERGGGEWQPVPGLPAAPVPPNTQHMADADRPQSPTDIGG